MTVYDITASTPVLAAIDVSKERHEVLIEAPDKSRRRRVSLLNNLDEFNRRITLLRSYQRPVRVAFEATGNYHRALAYQLGSAGFEVKLISSIALARTREALLSRPAPGAEMAVLFFPRASFKRSACMLKSAYIRFNRRFSSSRAFIWLIMEASMPPYFARHL